MGYHLIEEEKVVRKGRIAGREGRQGDHACESCLTKGRGLALLSASLSAECALVSLISCVLHSTFDSQSQRASLHSLKTFLAISYLEFF